MSRYSFTGFETSRSLLRSYEILAMEHKRVWTNEQTQAKLHNRTANENINLHHVFALLSLNASIVEGTLRSALTDMLMEDIETERKSNISRGGTEPTKAEKLFQKYHSEVEMQGGWNKLKEQYGFYFGKSFQTLVGNTTCLPIDVLFVLRNVISHGTAIIQPSSKMSDDMKDVYPYKWQSNLQQASVYLTGSFTHTDIFDNLKEHDLPYHFIEKTKELFKAVGKAIPSVGERAATTIAMIKEYEFGFKKHTV